MDVCSSPKWHDGANSIARIPIERTGKQIASGGLCLIGNTELSRQTGVLLQNNANPSTRHEVE